MKRQSYVTALLCCLLTIPIGAGIRAPGPYNGVVIFDRWDACYLYSGTYVMPISEQIEPRQRKAVATLKFTLLPGEYEFLAGYGGGVHESPVLVSNRVSFNVTEEGSRNSSPKKMNCHSERGRMPESKNPIKL